MSLTPDECLARRRQESYTERSLQPNPVYLTSNGREVQTGGGIAPDVAAAGKPVGALERSLIRQGAFFRFASQWLREHEGTPTQQAQLLESARGSDEARAPPRSQAVTRQEAVTQLNLLVTQLNRGLLDRRRTATSSASRASATWRSDPRATRRSHPSRRRRRRAPPPARRRSRRRARVATPTGGRSSHAAPSPRAMVRAGLGAGL